MRSYAEELEKTSRCSETEKRFSSIMERNPFIFRQKIKILKQSAKFSLEQQNPNSKIRISDNRSNQTNSIGNKVRKNPKNFAK